MAFLAFCTANLFNGYTIHFTGFDIVVKLFVNAVEFVALPGCFIVKINFAFAVAIYAPPHAKVCKLIYFGHLLYIAVTGLAILLAYFYMLAMVKIHMVGQVMNFHPVNWLAGLIVFFQVGVPAGVLI